MVLAPVLFLFYWFIGLIMWVFYTWFSYSVSPSRWSCKLYFSVPAELQNCRTVLSDPKNLAKNPGQKSDQKSGQNLVKISSTFYQNLVKSGPKSGHADHVLKTGLWYVQMLHRAPTLRRLIVVHRRLIVSTRGVLVVLALVFVVLGVGLAVIEVMASDFFLLFCLLGSLTHLVGGMRQSRGDTGSWTATPSVFFVGVSELSFYYLRSFGFRVCYIFLNFLEENNLSL